MGFVPNFNGAQQAGAWVVNPYAGVATGASNAVTGANLGSMGPLGTLTGSAGGAGGTGFNGPQGANIQSPVTADQVNIANNGAANSLGAQNALINALRTQGGINNQAMVFGQGQGLQNQLSGLGAPQNMGNAMGAQSGLNANLAGLGGTGYMGGAMAGQAGLANQLSGAGGVGAQMAGLGGLTNVYGQQQGLANQLQNIAAGRGPNPAQAMLNQQTGQNVANQAALMAGQRGAGANVGLMARQAAQQGAATQQQAVGQGATMQAQQSLGALGQLGGQQQAMAGTAQGMAGIGSGLVNQQQGALSGLYNQGSGSTGMLQTGIGQQFGQGEQSTGLLQGQQGLNAGIAQNQVGNILGANATGIQGNIANAGQQMGAFGGYNSNLVNMQGNINAGNVGLAQTGMQGQQAMLGGLMNGAGGAMSMAGGAMGGARGGEVRRYADGGDADAPYAAPNGQGPLLQEQPQAPGPAGTGVGGVGPLADAAPAPAPGGPQSALGQYLMGQSSTGDYLGSQPIQGVSQPQVQNSAPSLSMPSGTQMGYGSQMLYQGASNMSKGATKAGMAAAMAARGGVAHDYRGGGPVQARKPEEKAMKNGNSYSNDKIPAYLSEHEIVIPREVTMGKDPIRGSAEFVRKVLAKRRAS